MFVMGNSEGILKTFEVWVQNQFHKNVEFRSLSVVATDRFHRISPVESIKMKWGYPDHMDWVIPVEFNGVSLGQMKIKDGLILNEPALSRIFHFVDLSLAPQLYKKHLDLKVNNLESPETPDIRPALAITENTEITSSLTPALMSLVGSEEFRFRKIAFEIKERYEHLVAFIDYKDIASEMKTTEDFWRLNHVCLYLQSSDLEKTQTAKLLNDYLLDVEKHPHKERPLLIMGATTQKQVEELFGEIVQTSHVQTIHIDRWPLLQGDLQKVLDLILD